MSPAPAPTAATRFISDLCAATHPPSVVPMTAPATAPRQRYQAWLEEQLEEYKAALTRDELLDLAELAVERLFNSPDEQYPLTELLLCDAVDALLLERLNLPDYRQWRRTCQIDTPKRPTKRTNGNVRALG